MTGIEKLGPNLQQRNEIFRFIEQSGLNVYEFEWKYRRGRYISSLAGATLIHIPTGHYFQFDRSNNTLEQYRVEYSPGEASATQQINCYSTDEQFVYALDWVSLLRQDLETPDLWAAINRQKQLLLESTSPSIENAPFTRDEIRYIATRLDQVIEELLTDELAAQIAERLKPNFAYLKEASTRLGKRDWLMLVVAVFQVIQACALAPEQTQKIFRILYSILQDILRPLLTN